MGNYNEIEIDVHETHYSEDFQYLIDFLKWESKFYKYCPYCKRENPVQPSQFELEEELAESLLESLQDDEIEYLDSKVNMPDITMAIRLNLLLKDKTLTKIVKCSFNPDHEFMFIYQLNDNKDKNLHEFKKIGQIPSMSDFVRPQIDRHRNLMKKLGCYDDFVKASYMNASVTAIAAYTYLRRVRLF
ncbi:hypothetical protein [Paenibacillus sp. QZ-Y1]|uniref:hypothetical protein n=1 Tax=Paenibacillus sp. QZ-Y1 TaxID=3414511 RepID=UPI003F7A6076